MSETTTRLPGRRKLHVTRNQLFLLTPKTIVTEGLFSVKMRKSIDSSLKTIKQ